jgi:hypothetical protein
MKEKTIKVLSSIQAVLIAITLFTKDVKCQEFVVINEIVEWDMTSIHGFNFFLSDYIIQLPQNWEYPNNYKSGQFYTRYEIVSQASNEPCGIQFGIWQRRDNPPEGEKDYCEQMADIVPMDGPGSIIYNNSCPEDWWGSYGGVDFEKVNDFLKLGINIWSLDPRSVISSDSWGGDDEVWNDRDKWFPVKVWALVVAVAEGYTFSGWQNYEDPGSPLGTISHSINSFSDRNGDYISGEEDAFPFDIDFDHQSGKLRVFSENQKIKSIRILNIRGQVIYTGKVSDNCSTDINLSGQNEGLFLLNILTDNGVYNYKYIIYE